MRSAPRCSAGPVGATCRTLPSPKYSPSIGAGGNTNGIALDASRCGTPSDRAHADPLRALPQFDLGARLAKRHRHPAAIAHRGDRERIERAAVERRLHVGQRHRALQKPRERRVVEQARRPAMPPRRNERDEPARARSREMHRVGAVDVARVQLAPQIAQARRGAPKSWAPAAIAAALIAPADVPVTTVNGNGACPPAAIRRSRAGRRPDRRRGRRRRTARSRASVAWPSAMVMPRPRSRMRTSHRANARSCGRARPSRRRSRDRLRVG